MMLAARRPARAGFRRERSTPIASAALGVATPVPAPIAIPPPSVQVLGVTLVGIGRDTGEKVLLTLGLLLIVWLLRLGLHGAAGLLLRRRQQERARFWVRQGVSLALAFLLLIGVLSIWFNDPTRLATALGLVTAGLAFALQRVITALAGYVVILRGKTFNVGDRITMGGVRGDVIALGFIQTTLMEMGQPPSVQSAPPAMWVRSRQYTGRIVTVTNAKIFDDPVFNYTRDFPYLWEEIAVPITYRADRRQAEAILLACARRHAAPVAALSREALATMQERYGLRPADVEPAVYYRLTDNWLELTVRFVYREHGIRDVKDAMSRDILAGFDAAGIGIASATYDIVGFPPVRLESDTRARHDGEGAARPGSPAPDP